MTEMVVVVDDLCERGKCIEGETRKRVKVEGVYHLRKERIAIANLTQMRLKTWDFLCLKT